VLHRRRHVFFLFIFACLFTLWPFFLSTQLCWHDNFIILSTKFHPSRQQMRENVQWFLSWWSFLFPSNKYAIDFGILK
jgi:hypothetical protein